MLSSPAATPSSTRPGSMLRPEWRTAVHPPWSSRIAIPALVSHPPKLQVQESQQMLPRHASPCAEQQSDAASALIFASMRLDFLFRLSSNLSRPCVPICQSSSSHASTNSISAALSFRSISVCKSASSRCTASFCGMLPYSINSSICMILVFFAHPSLSLPSLHIVLEQVQSTLSNKKKHHRMKMTSLNSDSV